MLQEQVITSTVNPLDHQYGDPNDDSEYGHRRAGANVFGARILDSLEYIERIEEYGTVGDKDKSLDRIAITLEGDIQLCRRSVASLVGTEKARQIDGSYPREYLPDDFNIVKGGTLVDVLSEASDETFIKFVVWNRDYVDGLNREKNRRVRSGV